MSSSVTATFVFTDLVDSTATAARLGPEAAEELRQTHFRLLRGAVALSGGTEVKNLGDGLMVMYSSPSGALAGAAGMQQAIERHNRSADEPLGVRIGVSVGEAVEEDDDYFGDPVVEAARLCAVAEGGQILCAALVRALAHGRGDHDFRPLGALELKGLERPLEADEVQWGPLADEEATSMLPPVIAASTGFPLAGRAEQLAEIARAWGEVEGGATRVVLLAGEPGAGKTRLAAEAVRTIVPDGALVLAGRSDEHVSQPHQPFAEALSFQLECERDAIDLGSMANELRRIAPELASIFPGLEPPLAAAADAERMKLFDAVRGWLVANATNRPVALLLDDLHWADLGTVLLLRHVTLSVPVPGLLVLVTYRDTDIDRTHPLSSLLSELRRAGSVTRLPVRGLEANEVESLLSGAAGHVLDDAGSALAQAVYTETGGNPFFVSEVLRHLVESGAIEQRDGRWVAADPDAAVMLPEGIRDVVGRRVSTLPDASQRVLSTAAIIGPEFPLDLLAVVTGLDEDDALDALEPAVRAQLLQEVGVGAYRFAHALVQSTLEAELSDTRRARMHRRIGEALEKLHGDDPTVISDLARHWAAASAGSDPAAFAHVERAAEHALAQAAPAEAARWYRVAIDLVDDDPRREVELLVQAGNAETLAGLRAGHTTLLEAARRADAIGAIDLMVTALRVFDRRTSDEGSEADPDKMALLERALEQLPLDDAERRAPIVANLAFECIFTGELERRLALVAEGETLCAAMRDPLEQMRVETALNFARPFSDSPARLEEAAAELVARAALVEAADDASLRLSYLSSMFYIHLGLGRRAQVDAALEGLAAFAATGHPLAEDNLPLYLALAALIDGRLSDAQHYAEEMKSRWTAHEVPELVTYGPSFDLEIGRESGLLQLTGGDVATDVLTRSPGPRPDVLAGLAARIFVEIGRHDEALAIVEQRSRHDFADLPDEAALPVALAAFAEASAATGHQRAAAALYERLAAAPDSHHLWTGGWYLGSGQRYLALLADALDRPDEADERFALALAAHEAMATPPWIARTLLDWADHAAALGDTTAARERAESALAAIGKLPLTVQRERAERLLVAL